MKKYTAPELELIRFNVEDVVATSTLTDGGADGDFTGGGASGAWGTPTTVAVSPDNLFN